MEVWTQRITCKVSYVIFARDPLLSYFPEPIKKKKKKKKWNSSVIFTLCFYIVFVHYLWNFANKRRRKVIIRRVWLLRSKAVTMTWRQSNVTSANQLLHLSLTSLTRNVAWTSVVHGCMILVGPKWVHLMKLLASVRKYMLIKKKKKKKKNLSAGDSKTYKMTCMPSKDSIRSACAIVSLRVFSMGCQGPRASREKGADCTTPSGCPKSPLYAHLFFVILLCPGSVN